MSNEDFCELTATEIARLVRSKEASPTEVLESVLARMERLEPTLHAFCTPTPDLAREDAALVERDIMRGLSVGPLAGVPVGIKDLISTAGIRTSGGSAAYASFVPDEDDVTVERVRAAGAVRLGKTNVPEFGYSGVGHNPVYATTRNPWNPELTPGGSSAGSGAAVAAGMGPIALGSDGGGSVRIPAAHCGIVGMKASMGRVPLYPGCRDERYPGFSSWESLEHIGPMARTVGDAALLLSAIAGPDPRDRHSIPTTDVDWEAATRQDLPSLKIAFSADLGYVTVDPEVRAIVERAALRFEQELGCVVEGRDPGWSDPFGSFWGIVAADSDLVGMRQLAAQYGDRMTPHLKTFLDTPWSAEQLTSAAVGRKSVCNKMWQLMQDYDLLVTPTLTVPPFPVHMQGPERVDDTMVDPFAWLSFTLPFNLTGSPAISLPAGWTKDGRPVGIQLVGRHLADATVLAAAAAYERVYDWRSAWPELTRAADRSDVSGGASS